MLSWKRKRTEAPASEATPRAALPTFATWAQARAASGGYDAEVILERAMAAARAVKRGDAAFERDTVLFCQPDYRWQLLACVASLAAANAGTLRVLDIGGAVGSVYFQHRAFFRSFPHLSWAVVEQAHIAAAGQRELADGTLGFFLTVEEAVADGPAHLAIFSSSLHYFPEPFDMIRRAAATGVTHIIIDRIPLTDATDDGIVVETVPEEIYPASYPAWRLSERKLLAFMATLGFAEKARYRDGIDPPDHLGLFFEKRNTAGNA